MTTSDSNYQFDNDGISINTDNFTLDKQGNATFSGSLSGASGDFAGSITTPDVKLYESSTGGVMEMYHSGGSSKIVHLGNKRDYTGASDSGTLVLSGEDGIGKTALSVGDSSGAGYLILANSEISSDPLSSYEGLYLNGGTVSEGSIITFRDPDKGRTFVMKGYASINDNSVIYIYDGNGNITSQWAYYRNGDYSYFSVDQLDATTKNFKIDNPSPSMEDTFLKHSSVETPTEGDNLYRYLINIDGSLEVTIDLPDYFKYLNKNSQVFVTPQGHFGSGFGNISENQLIIKCNQEGKYNVLVIGTRKDVDAERLWEGAVVSKEGDK